MPKCLKTRVNSASVTIDGEVVGEIGKGFLILLGVGPNDTAEHCKFLAQKALGLRIFEDENGKMNLGLEAVEGQVLVVSQFTLYGNCRKGRRPSFVEAAPPALGEELYLKFLDIC
ncbi:MAG: D-tyrosyl-tRNA(Tyr) deacylase, partial [Bacteroidaceae bacterium]|nr:D-tyrosyl-tRNA(Tyr) deacylase [Bacteroidaceae bacterium]